ncbi:MAG TPA: sulfite exporter TauE/SafE family protein, partial [Candidatus Acidoferrum sp.]|nr:sulfite exporter TauE/SafE family protein [Candidatus Acidoferrum sp.]
MAEIPTFQEFQQNDLVAQADDPRVRSYLSNQAEAFRKGLFLTLNGKPLSLEATSQEILFSPGAGNLPTMKFGVVYRAQASDACAVTPCELEYRDMNFSGRVGWKEVVTSPGHGISIDNSSVPLRDRSTRLSNYPTDLIDSPPQDVGARVVYSVKASSDRSPSAMLQGKTNLTPPATIHPQGTKGAQTIKASARSAPPLASTSGEISHPDQLKPNQQATPRNSFTELMAARQISFVFVAVAAAIAAGLGALHALEPGHGKTIVAAYLIGSRGTARHALLLGMVVTISHTAGVYLLGAITLYAQRYILPDRIYPFFGVLSGALIAGMGCYLLLQRYLGTEFSHKHDYSGAANREFSGDMATNQPGKFSARQLVVLGVTGGIVPCPAALVVLLSAIALHRTVFGLYLIVAFSLGLAAVLIAMGMVTVYAGRLMSRLRLEGPFIQKWLPMGSAAMITFLGFGIAVRSLTTTGLLHIRIL